MRKKSGPHIVLGPIGRRKCRLPLADFDTHMYVVGKAKKGKSKFLVHVAYQLIVQGQGCGLLDPHSDLTDDLLSYLAPYLEDEDARARLIYSQQGRDDVLLPFNVLASDQEPYTVAQNALEAFRRTWPESLAGLMKAVISPCRPDENRRISWPRPGICPG